MFYNYQCPVDRHLTMEEKMVSERDQIVRCKKCGSIMTRLIQAPMAIIKSYGHMNHGLGIRETSKTSKSDAIKRIRDTEGRELVEVGNEKPRDHKRTNIYDLPRGVLDAV